MQDDEITLFNLCTDLVSLKKFEALPKHLLNSRPSGQWVSVSRLCQQLGLEVANLNADLFVVWLADPLGDEEYAVVIFYDDESKWTMSAQYNRQRVMEGSVGS